MTPRVAEKETFRHCRSASEQLPIDPVQRETFRRFFIDLETETNSFNAEAKD
ncbi:hypothetical protein [Pseudarthrobacter sp. NIBRBAC000502772]|uniref:hypothetical protein n=1 Tax=Pseudarthrobacter sp. NIBRBAC000502772 TaxID=2590775 RepID=UPI00143CF3BB|nr:hypothetical protein [Pseudarthrobacter sp. NIBRBAC000502772]